MVERVLYGLHTVFLVHPVSTAAIDGTTVQFTCTAENANLELSYIVDNMQASLQAIIDRGFTQSLTDPLGGNIQRRNLTVIASSALNNNSNITCAAVNGAEATISDIATLTVQGE